MVLSLLLMSLVMGSVYLKPWRGLSPGSAYQQPWLASSPGSASPQPWLGSDRVHQQPWGGHSPGQWQSRGEPRLGRAELQEEGINQDEESEGSTEGESPTEVIMEERNKESIVSLPEKGTAEETIFIKKPLIPKAKIEKNKSKKNNQSDNLDFSVEGKEMINKMISKLKETNKFLSGIIQYWDEYAGDNDDEKTVQLKNNRKFKKVSKFTEKTEEKPEEESSGDLVTDLNETSQAMQKKQRRWRF